MTNITEAMKVRKAVDEAKKLCGGCGKPWDVATAYREWDTRFGDDGHDNVGQDRGDYQHYHPECLPQRTLVHKLRDVDDFASLTFLGATIAEETRLELFKSRCYQIDNWLKEAPRDEAHWHHDDDRNEVLLHYLEAKIRFLRDFPTRDFIYWPSGWLICIRELGGTNIIIGWSLIQCRSFSHIPSQSF